MSSSGSFFDGSPFLLDAVADRFEVVLRRYQLFVKEVPRRFEQWLATAPSQKRVFASLDSICTELFPDLLSIVSTEFPQRWMLPVACVALKHHVWACPPDTSSNVVELSDCGRALRVVAERSASCPRKRKEQEQEMGAQDRHSALLDAMCCAGRTAALEVHVAELECRSQGLLPPSDSWVQQKHGDGGARKRKRGSVCSRRRRPKEEGEEANPTREEDEPVEWGSVEHILVYLNECRVEALDALAALRKVRHRSRRQAAQLDSAHMELSRLKEQVNVLQRKQLAPAALLATSYILPKRALSLAGFWNLEPNDLLRVTPLLIDAVGQCGGTIVRREGMQPCFASGERALVMETVSLVMAQHLPHHAKRREEDF